MIRILQYNLGGWIDLGNRVTEKNNTDRRKDK